MAPGGEHPYTGHRARRDVRCSCCPRSCCRRRPRPVPRTDPGTGSAGDEPFQRALSGTLPPARPTGSPVAGSRCRHPVPREDPDAHHPRPHVRPGVRAARGRQAGHRLARADRRPGRPVAGLHARRRAGVPGHRRRARPRLGPHRSRQRRGRPHERDRGARARGHRAGGGDAGHGGQGRAVQAVRRDRRLPGLRGRPLDRRDGGDRHGDRPDVRRHQPRGHRRAGLLRDRAAAAGRRRHPGVPRRPARHGDRRAGGGAERRARRGPPAGRHDGDGRGHRGGRGGVRPVAGRRGGRRHRRRGPGGRPAPRSAGPHPDQAVVRRARQPRRPDRRGARCA